VNSNQKHFALYALFLTLVAFLLRVFRLDFFSLRGDEAFTVIFVQRTWEGLWRGISTIEPNPPLLYLLLRAWVFLAGTSEFATRFFSASFGVLCVPLLYRLAGLIASPAGTKQSPSHAEEIASSPRSTTLRSAHDASRNDTATWVALFAGTLIAINPYQIWHSQDARNYTLWPALSLAALIFFWKWWNTENSNGQFAIGNLLFYFLLTTASLYTHYYDVFILAAENIFVFTFALAPRRWKTLGRWVGAQAALVLVYAPWVLFGTNRITTYGEASAEQGVSLLDQFSRTIATFTVGDTVPANFHAIIWLPAALVLVTILGWLARKNLQRSAFLFFWIAVPTLALYALSLGRPLFNERYLNAIAPAYYLAFAIGLGAIYPPRAAWHTLAFSLAVLFLALVPAYALANYWYDPNYSKSPDWRGLTQFINANLRDGDILVQNFNEVALQYYRRGNAPVITVPRDYWWRAEDAQTLARVNQDYRRIWFVPAQPDWWDPQQDAQKFLSRYDDRNLENDISVFHLQLYSTPREFESRLTSVNARVGTATLAGYHVQKNGNALRVVLFWRGASIEKDLHVFVHLAQADGRVIAQSDGVPVEGTYPTTAWKPGETIVDAYEIKTDAIGAFTLFAGMYDPNSSVRAMATDPTGARYPDDRVLLTQINFP
jgi:uncharacterized membrane protein